ncbi:hypothetical protein CUJ89_18705 [Burkholderia pyrrocinia]|uniref:Uncharacterized protein n=1 Tax=Burkholderia pyrrocinia TaxID=60550 RepID=A0A2Z5N0B5_BURPY|nr:hypothetical protein [Burkholderia pyrrocinia]AXF22560.1 hypothetical protein CUJ89_18705 [Burkholderia pyrrocinia]
MNLITHALDKWKQQSLSGKLYASGNGLVMLVAGALMLMPRTMTHTLTLFAAGPLLLFMAGFLIWVVPKLLAIGRSQVGTVPLVVVSAVLAPLCLGWARQCVGMAVQLPPQSFDVTVALLTVLLIPIAWAAVAASILILVFAVSIFAAMTSQVFRPLVGTFAMSPTGWLARTLGKIEAAEREAFNHGMGAFVSAAVIVLLFGCYASAVLDPAVVRLAAYGLDFSYANRYPGVEPGRRIRLLDNGFVAYAARQGLDVRLDVMPLPPSDKTK